MGLSQVAAVLSRRFVLGTFIPWLAALVIVWQVVDDRALPSILHNRSSGVAALIVGASAVVVGSLCQATLYPTLRLLEGYPIEGIPKIGPRFVARQERLRDELTTQAREAPAPGEDDLAKLDRQRRRGRAASSLSRRFPPVGNRVLPTGFGNALRAAERYPNDRYGMDGVRFWPRLEPLLSEREQALHEDAQTSLDTFVGMMQAGTVAGVWLVADVVIFSEYAPVDLLRLLPFVVVVAAYNQAVRAAMGWGERIRAAYDLHHLEVFDALGLKRPESLADERARATKLGQFIIFGAEAEIPDDWLSRDAAR